MRPCRAAPPTPPAPAPAEIIDRTCAGPWVASARYVDRGDSIQTFLRPTERAWSTMGAGGLATPLWDAYFTCIGWDDGLDRLTEGQWRSLWLQHRCHEFFGRALRRLSGNTFDYDSRIPGRGSLARALAQRCN